MFSKDEHDALDGILGILAGYMPSIFYDPDWSTATCGECGYWTKYQKGAIEARYESWCRKINAIQVDKDTPACPSFVRRPKEAPDAKAD